MASTYTWANIISHVGRFIKGSPTSTIDAQTCDYVSSEMWAHFPFKESITTIAATSIPLVDSQQDYSVPANYYRLLNARISRTDTSPQLDFELSVASNLVVDMVPRSHVAIRSVAYDPGTGQFRLESAVQVPSGTTLYLRGDVQINPSKVTSTASGVWFADQYAHVAASGILYYYYKLTDDPRAGAVTMGEDGDPVYTGQLAEFKSKLLMMERAEDYPGIQGLFPGESMGAGRDTNRGLVIYP